MGMDAKPWNCVVCGTKIGDVVAGQLVFTATSGNTDDSNIVLRCPSCGAPKTWFTFDKLDKLIDSIAVRVAYRTSQRS